MALRVEVDDFGLAPIDDPDCSPGLRTRSSYVFCGDHLLALDRLDFDVELAAVGAPPLGERSAVLAYGSNASPAQLARKYRDSVSSPFIPMTRAWVQDLAVGFCDHQSSYGAIPAAAFAAANVHSEVFVAWLDAAQLADLDATEGSAYDRVPFDLGAHPLCSTDGPVPATAGVYESRLELLVMEGGVVPAMKGIDTSYRAGPLLTQALARALRAST
jgi:hypothetical protein